MLSVVSAASHSCCQSWNDSYNTNSSSASVVTVIRNHSHMCACAMFTSHGYYLRAVFISFESFGSCGYYSRAASIRRNTVFRVQTNNYTHSQQPAIHECPFQVVVLRVSVVCRPLLGKWPENLLLRMEASSLHLCCQTVTSCVCVCVCVCVCTCVRHIKTQHIISMLTHYVMDAWGPQYPGFRAVHKGSPTR